jgi:hypothetical protein
MKDLPIQKGTKVRIKKGTMVRSIRQAEPKAAGRTYTVQVDHVLSGQSMVIGTVYPDGSWHWQVRTKDMAGAMARRGLPYTEASMEVLKEEAMKDLRSRTIHDGSQSTVKQAWLHVTNPSVRWAGSGGYWHEADLSEVEAI